MPWFPKTPAEFWTAVSAAATVCAFIAAAIYAYLTYRVLTVMRATLEREDRPLLRLSAVKPGSPPSIINLGKGVACTSVVLNPDKSLLRFFWTIRPGEREDRGDLRFTTGATYFVYCQDNAGRWHLTTATPEEHRTHNRFHGVVSADSVPAIVRSEAQVDTE